MMCLQEVKINSRDEGTKRDLERAANIGDDDDDDGGLDLGGGGDCNWKNDVIFFGVG